MSDELPPRSAQPAATRSRGDTDRLGEMQTKLRAFNAERDWGQYHSPRNLAMALSVEAGELLELFLWSRDEGPQPALASRSGRVADEAADVLICLLNFCEQAGVDLPAAFAAKLERNAQRYPVEQARGRMHKHDELAAEREPDGE